MCKACLIHSNYRNNWRKQNSDHFKKIVFQGHTQIILLLHTVKEFFVSMLQEVDMPKENPITAQI